MSMHKIIRHIASLGLFISFIAIPVHAQANTCELLAKQFQKEKGGDLIFIQPLKENGAFDLGDYNGHWLNRVYSKTLGQYYYDPSTKTTYHEKQSIEKDFEQIWNKEVVIFNLNKEVIPFALKFYY